MATATLERTSNTGSMPVDQMKALLRQGLYWEALGLCPQSSRRETAIRVAELQLAHRSDGEAVVLLAEAKVDLQCGSYPDARALCDRFFERIDGQLQTPILDEERLDRERVWRDKLRRGLSGQSDGSGIAQCGHLLGTTLRAMGVHVANELQRRLQAGQISIVEAIRAADKSIHALEVAREFARDKADIERQLGAAKHLRDALQGLSSGVAPGQPRTNLRGNPRERSVPRSSAAARTGAKTPAAAKRPVGRPGLAAGLGWGLAGVAGAVAAHGVLSALAGLAPWTAWVAGIVLLVAAYKGGQRVGTAAGKIVVATCVSLFFLGVGGTPGLMCSPLATAVFLNCGPLFRRRPA